ncbi:hypothetical protein [Photobacterium sp. GB-72]|uniref:hypothetical protein n=1 Tax=Photobacterium sp. GB-72 TaxID=2022105 RepID=UPI000D172449|nr:hypothetical protein [Photobacterium sp. GB-72]PSV30332.1 hypothetical protein C9J40_13700 [Photobacterium sp. GB-72]
MIFKKEWCMDTIQDSREEYMNRYPTPDYIDRQADHGKFDPAKSIEYWEKKYGSNSIDIYTREWVRFFNEGMRNGS